MLRVGDRGRLADHTGCSCFYLCQNTGQSRRAGRGEDLFNSETRARACDLPEEVAVCEDNYMVPFG